MKRLLRPEALIAVVTVVALAIIGAVTVWSTDRPVLTTGPCSMLGLAELADHPGQPFLVIDCEGFQFGVPAVLP